MKEVNNLYAIFQNYDADGSGQISVQELQSAMSQNADHLSGLSASMFSAVDKDGSGEVCFRELLALYFPYATRAELDFLESRLPKEKPKEVETEKHLTEEQREEISAIFRQWDEDGSDGISLEELQEAMSTAGFSEEELEEMFRTYDGDGNGFLDEEEFTQAMANCYI
jgi:Ca2+-binding EF-hand superfamily protein